MPIETILIELGDVASKIENARSLLQPGRAAVLAPEDRDQIEALLARLILHKTALEDRLRGMVQGGSNGRT